MIHDEIVTHEVSKLAKEKGFPQHIGNDAYIVENEYDDEYEVGCHYPIQFIPDYLPIITAPTQSLLQRWLREEKGLHIVIESEPTTTTSNNMLFQWIINYNSDGECYDCYNDIRAYPSYEKTLESALKFTLENLI